VVAALGCGALVATANPAVVYTTGFESPDFKPDLALVPQGGWVNNVTGGDQVVTEFFTGGGQQALLGYSAPQQGSPTSVSVWKPLNFDPLTAHQPLVTFKVSFAIYDCTAANLAFRDAFRWSVWNQTNRLFTLDFDNATLEISYKLDDAEDGLFPSTQAVFERVNPDAGTGLYDLEIHMDFALNRWSAVLNDITIVNAQPLTTKGASLVLGDVDAVWVKARKEGFGDNYMVFDNYRVEADVASPQRFHLEALGRLANGSFVLRLRGEEGRRYAIEASAGFSGWTGLKTNLVADGSFDYVDGGAASAGQRFYRAREVTP